MSSRSRFCPRTRPRLPTPSARSRYPLPSASSSSPSAPSLSISSRSVFHSIYAPIRPLASTLLSSNPPSSESPFRHQRWNFSTRSPRSSARPSRRSRSDTSLRCASRSSRPSFFFRSHCGRMLTCEFFFSQLPSSQLIANSLPQHHLPPSHHCRAPVALCRPGRPCNILLAAARRPCRLGRRALCQGRDLGPRRPLRRGRLGRRRG